MTKKQFTQKINELKRENNKFITEKSKKILNSGAINLPDWDDDFRLPKIVMHIICKELVWQWEPLAKELQKEAKNLEYFI